MDYLIEELVNAIPRRAIGQIRALPDETRLELLRGVIDEAARRDKADWLAARAKARSDETWRRAHEALDQSLRLGSDKRLAEEWTMVVEQVRAPVSSPPKQRRRR
jgi:hypothetical protein